MSETKRGPLLTKKHLILASGSKSRRAILERTGLAFDVIPSTIDESKYRAEVTHLTLPERALILASKKAESISDIHPNSVVIGADQICALGDHIFSKPGNRDNTKVQLRELSGKTHQLYSAVSLYERGDQVWSTVETVNLTMHAITNEEIDTYLELEAPYDACGGYYFESMGCHLFKKVDGETDTIQGIPKLSTLNALKSFNVYNLI